MTTQPEMPEPGIPEETLGDRMRRALRKEHLSVQDMAEYLGVSRNTVGTWINDHVRPSEQTFKLWALRTGVPLEWLKHGQVQPFPGRLAGNEQQSTTTDATSAKLPITHEYRDIVTPYLKAVA